MLAQFRGVTGGRQPGPEDWVGSTTTAYGERLDGLTIVDGGRTLRDAIAAEPARYLGPRHVARYGDGPAVLVKLLDAGERLAVHCHPSREFAQRHFGCAFGKTEGWVIVGTERPTAPVYVGFREDCPADDLRAWVSGQQTGALLSALNEVQVRAGNVVLIPGGVPHAIGAGIFLIELQEPTDFSVFLEQPPDGPRAGDHLGLPLETSLACVDHAGWDSARLGRLLGQRDQVRPGAQRLFPAHADPFFRAERLTPRPTVSLEPAFSILIAVRGTGSLAVTEARLPVRAGDTIMIPFGAGPAALSGELEVIRCLPPLPA